MNQTKNSTYFTLSQAHKVTGKSKSVISKALKNGELSYIEKNSSGYKIDPSELFRVYPKKNEKTFENELEEQRRTSANYLRTKEIEMNLGVVEKERDFYKQQLDKVEMDRDKWRDQAQKLLLSPPVNTGISSNVFMSKNMMVFSFFIVILMIFILISATKIYGVLS